MRYIYGIVKSRRLKNSLGINLTPYKICSFDCVYCQLGRTAKTNFQRAEYIKIEDILVEIDEFFSSLRHKAGSIDYITLSGAGEPSLNIKLGELISLLKKKTNIPVAVITNSSMLKDAGFRRELLNADLILPSLDAVSEEVFWKINRPHKDIKLKDILDGLAALRKEFSGKIWVEVMLIKGINDDLRHIEKLKEFLLNSGFHTVHLNTPTRIPSGLDIKIAPPKPLRLKKIKAILGEGCEVI